MREDQIDQAERQAVLENDRLVLEQQRGSTLHQHGVSQASELSGGRFGATGAPTVIASKPSVASQYPAAAAQQRDPVGAEPPLGIDINAMPFDDPAGVPSVTAPAATGDPASGGDAPLTATSGEEQRTAAGSPFRER